MAANPRNTAGAPGRPTCGSQAKITIGDWDGPIPMVAKRNLARGYPIGIDDGLLIESRPRGSLELKRS